MMSSAAPSQMSCDRGRTGADVLEGLDDLGQPEGGHAVVEGLAQVRQPQLRRRRRRDELLGLVDHERHVVEGLDGLAGDGVDDRQEVAGVGEELDLLARVHRAPGFFEPGLRQVEIGLDAAGYTTRDGLADAFDLSCDGRHRSPPLRPTVGHVEQDAFAGLVDAQGLALLLDVGHRGLEDVLPLRDEVELATVESLPTCCRGCWSRRRTRGTGSRRRRR